MATHFNQKLIAGRGNLARSLRAGVGEACNIQLSRNSIYAAAGLLLPALIVVWTLAVMSVAALV